METSSQSGSEPFGDNRTLSAFDRRHPSSANLNYMLADELMSLKLSAQYEKGRLAMEAFFADGRPRPEHGDESY